MNAHVGGIVPGPIPDRRFKEAAGTRRYDARRMTPIAPSVAPPLRIALDGTALLGQRTGIGQLTANLGQALAARDDVSVVAYAIGRAAWRDLPPHACPPVCEPAPPASPALRGTVLKHAPRGPRSNRGPDRSTSCTVRTTRRLPPGPRWWSACTTSPSCTGPISSSATRTRSGPPSARCSTAVATVHVISDFVGAEVPRRVQPAAGAGGEGLSGDHRHRGWSASAGRALAGSDRYVLTLGQLEDRANLPTLVRAFDRVA